MLATFAFLHPDDFLVRLLGIVPRFLSFLFFGLRIINKKLFSCCPQFVTLLILVLGKIHL